VTVRASPQVGIIDTGISLSHQDLVGNVDPHCEDFYNNDGSCDESHRKGGMHGHGTHVAGIIGAVGNNALGVVGVNWHVEMVGCTIFSDSEESNSAASVSAAIKCLNWL
jgi:serine protease